MKGEQMRRYSKQNKSEEEEEEEEDKLCWEWSNYRGCGNRASSDQCCDWLHIHLKDFRIINYSRELNTPFLLEFFFRLSCFASAILYIISLNSVPALTQLGLFFSQSKEIFCVWGFTTFCHTFGNLFYNACQRCTLVKEHITLYSISSIVLSFTSACCHYLILGKHASCVAVFQVLCLSSGQPSLSSTSQLNLLMYICVYKEAWSCVFE